MAQERLRGSQGGLAAVALLLVAFTNPSLYGSAFLVLSLIWAIFFIPSVYKRRAVEISKALWGFACVLSAVALVLQIGVQLAYAAAAPGILSPGVIKVLEILGFPVIASLVDFFTIVGPLALALVLAAQQAGAVARHAAFLARHAAEGVELHTLETRHRDDVRVSSYRNGGVIAAMALGVAALSVPTLLAAPYLVAITVALLRWSQGVYMPDVLDPGAKVTLQAYAAIHLSVLYIWQWALSYALWLQPVGDVLGLYVLTNSTGLDIWLEAAQCIALGVLVMALGYGLRGGAGRAPRGLTVIARLLNVQNAQQGLAASQSEPLLTEILEGDDDTATEEHQLTGQHDSRENSGRISWAKSLLPAIAELFISAFETGYGSGALVAGSLCMLAMIHTSAIGCVMLIIGLVLLAWSQSGSKRLPRSLGRTILSMVLLWVAACYIATSLVDVMKPSDMVESLGVHVFSTGGPMAAMLFVAAGVAAHLRSTRIEDHPVSHNMHSEEAWVVFQRHCIQSIDALGIVVLPIAVFAVGISKYSILHAGFVAGALVPVVRATLPLMPSFDLIAPKQTPYRILRTYTTTVLCFMYAMRCYDVFGRTLPPAEAQHVLELLGLWHITTKDMLPVLGVLLLACLHAPARAAALAQSSSSSRTQPPLVGDIATWRSPWVISLSRKVTGYGPAVIAATVYAVVLLDCNIAAVGLVYLALAALLLAMQPKKGRWQTRNPEWIKHVMLGADNEENSGARKATLVDSPSIRWASTTALATVALVVLLTQAVLPAIVALDTSHCLPVGVLDFLRDAVGIDSSATGSDLAVRLLRPGIIIGALALYRGLYCLGVLHRQLQNEVLDEHRIEMRRLAKQWGIGALLKRLVILHASKIVALVAFAAAMQSPSGLGWAIVVGLVVFPPLLGPPSSATVHHQGSLRKIVALTQLGASLWLLAQYAALIPWVQDTLAPYPFIVDLLAWIGINTSAASTLINLESLLRLKGLLLVSVALKRRSLQWWGKLPSDVKEAASCGAACPLFWPPAPNYPRSDDLHENSGSSSLSQQQSQVLGSSNGGLGALDAARMAFASAAGRARAIAHQALEAVDWPSSPRTETLLLEEDEADNTAMPEASTSHQQPPSPPSLDTTPLHQLTAFRFALQAWMERWFAEWGLEAGFLALLIAAFLAANALSLVYMALVGVGMAAPPDMRRVVWRWACLPTLAAALIWQYGQLAGLPPHSFTQNAWGWAPDSKADLQTWLGLGKPEPGAVWALFIAYASTVLQVHFDAWEQCDRNNRREGLTAPLLVRNQGQQRVGAGWAPLSYAAQATWQWHDWARYAAYRWYLDIVLVAVVALCTLDNDIVHAGYLALALFFFRARIALRSRRNALFFWLPTYNFAVMVVVLAYQAPFEDFWDWSLDEGKTCTVAHLLGLYKLRPASSSGGDLPRKSLLSWGYQGAATDLVLWGFIRLQAHMFSSATYGEVVAVIQSEEEVERAARKADISAWKDRQAAAAASESRHRAARVLRISRIKEGVDRSLGKFGTGINPSGLDYAFLEPHKDQDDSSRQTGDVQGTSSVSEAVQPSIVRRRTTPSRRDTAYEREPHIPSPLNNGASTQLLADYEHQVAAASEADLAAAAVQRREGLVPPASTAAAHLLWSSRVHSWVTSRLRRADRRESAVAYALFVFAYLSDLSLLTLVLPVSAFVYALVAPRPARAYWQAILLYCETLIVASYAFQVPSRLRCGFITPSMEYTAEMLGIHSNAARCIPLFLVYLATLTHTYSLVSRHEAGRRIAAAAEADASARPSTYGTLTKGQEATATDLETGPGETPSSQTSIEEEREGESLPALPTSSPNGVRPSAMACEFLLGALTVCEAPPSFIIVEVDSMVEDSHQLEAALQGRIDAWRAIDLEAARRWQNEEQYEEHSGNDAASWRAALETEGRAMQQTGYTRNASEGVPDLAKMGPLQVRFHSYLDKIGTGAASKESQGKSDAAVHTRALFEVIPLPATASNSPGISSAPGWPLRSLHPAAHAAATLLRGIPQVSSVAQGAGTSDIGLEVTSTEAHSRQAHDLYAATSSLDMLAFIFVALFYNRMVEAAGSLSDITSQHVVPLGYLLTLMVLFAFVVLDRVVYTLGSPAGKSVLHLGEMVLYFWYCSTLVWGDPHATSLPPLGHLRVLLFLKCCSFALGALQLRSGYPSPASYSNGMGRHTFVFMRSVSVPASLAFHVFTAVPFLYEMRQLLDWSCTPTTLTLYDWLKLEDVNMSLYFSAVMRKSKAGRAKGARQPRYLKIFQGALLFTALLLLLWVPLLVFSTGNPTYTVPSMVAFSANVTLEASVPTPSSQFTSKTAPAPQWSKLRSQLYQGGERGVWVPWSGRNDTLPTALAANYVPTQLQLLCTPPDADGIWGASLPAQTALEDALSNTDASVVVAFGWSMQRDLPPPSDHGGPLCQGSTAVELAWPSRDALLSMLLGEESVAPLLRIDETGNATSALFPAFWLLRGDSCEARQLESGDLPGAERLPGRRQRPDFSWADRWLACNASLEGRDPNQKSAGAWWRLECEIVDSKGTPVLNDPDQPDEGRAACGSSFTGPQLVAVLDRVQGGIIGATLTKFGVIGLYSVFVYGIGRFLRLAVTNLRMRIMYEDLPTTRRLVALCQDVYIARAEGLLELEEELYGALLAVYRLPSVLYELSKKTR